MEEKGDEKSKEDSLNNIVFIGSKNLINYVNSISMQLKSNSEVIIKARGKFISKAVDIVEVAKRRLQDQVSVKDIKLGTEEYESEGKSIRVSTIDVILSK